MSEIEKLYENAEIKPLCQIPDGYCGVKNVYEDFTAEEQLELIKWLMRYRMLDEISLYFNEPSKTYNLMIYSLPEIGGFRSTYTETQNSFADMLAGLINNLWQSLTEEEQQQIKEILE